MKQTDLGLNQTTKRTRMREFLAQTERVVPWDALVELVSPYAPEGKKGRPPFALQTMLRIHVMLQWFTLSDPAIEEALHDTTLIREFAGLGWDTRLPDESTILRFRHLLEKQKLAEQTLALVN
jgi:IS5 family transposase